MSVKGTLDPKIITSYDLTLHWIDEYPKNLDLMLYRLTMVLYSVYSDRLECKLAAWRQPVARLDPQFHDTITLYITLSHTTHTVPVLEEYLVL